MHWPKLHLFLSATSGELLSCMIEIWMTNSLSSSDSNFNAAQL